MHLIRFNIRLVEGFKEPLPILFSNHGKILQLTFSDGICLQQYVNSFPRTTPFHYGEEGTRFLHLDLFYPTKGNNSTNYYKFTKY